MKRFRLALIIVAILFEFVGIVLLVARYEPAIGITVLVLGSVILTIAMVAGRGKSEDER